MLTAVLDFHADFPGHSYGAIGGVLDWPIPFSGAVVRIGLHRFSFPAFRRSC